MPTYIDNSSLFMGQFDETRDYITGNITIKDDDLYIKTDNDTWNTVSTTATISYNPKDSVYYTSAGSLYDYPEPKHFNCKRCGAPNQIDVCEYCGSAYE